MTQNQEAPKSAATRSSDRPVEKKLRSLRPKRSLRTILMMWFLMLSLVPMMFVTGYSLVNYERAIDNELIQRLRGDAREFVTTTQDYEQYLSTRRNRYKSDTLLPSYLLTNSTAQIRQQLQGLVRMSAINTSVSVFNQDGEVVASYSRDDAGNPKQNTSLENANLVLSDTYKDALEKEGQMTIVDVGPGNSMDLIAYTRLETANKRRAGYIEEIINIGPVFLENLKKRLNLETIVFDSKGQIVAGSHADFLLYPKDSFTKTIATEQESFFDLTIRDEPFVFITNKVKWGESEFYVALGASKQRAKTFVKNINTAFFTMMGAIGLLLIMSSIIATRIIVRPVNELVDALQMTDVRDVRVEIPVTTDTELGVLTESFNEMSRRIHQAKGELEGKIQELEAAYSDLKDTQARLVHSAKMASLGQMVAGIAHELNNPIGFIFSNMSHLRDYSQRLMKIIEVAEKNPKDLEKAKVENDYAYITEDLPRLISSCEDGARRTRDIVLGLRNFSRLEEAKIKRVSLKEGIENTLRLLTGETKNRIRIHVDLQPVPEVLCYASQLNQVFMNILTNAIQAIEGEGEIWVTLSQVEEKGRPPLAQVSIRDSGKGMPSEVIEKIFDPFFTTKSVGQGTGLGLSISYGIVKKHGGDIQVKSEPGKGTEFIVSVPVNGPKGSELTA